MAFERLEPATAEWDAYYPNHIHRYIFAAEKLAGRGVCKVLDAACGVGYGSRHLAQSLGAKVTAVDRDPLALETARKQFASDSVSFIQDDCQEPNHIATEGPFDAVVSFETLEHLKKPDAFLKACHSVLIPSGILVLSFPNGNTETKGDWEYHEHEYKALEAQALLQSCGFSICELFGQTFSPMGRLRDQLRSEIHVIRSNPMLRVGFWLQRVLRGVAIPAALKPELDDFAMLPFSSPQELDNLGPRGPFVVVVVARKSAD